MQWGSKTCALFLISSVVADITAREGYGVMSGMIFGSRAVGNPDIERAAINMKNR